MGRVAIITDSTADLSVEAAAAHGIRIVPLYVRFGDREFQAGVDLSTAEFWARMVAPDAPFPTTAAASPGDFEAAFEAEFAAGAEAIVCVSVGAKLSATLKSAELGAQGLPGREIHLVDSASASMGVGLLTLVAAEMATAGIPAAEIAARVRARVADIDLYVALDTIEYLRKGGRLSPARAAIATVLSIKPIITVIDGLVDRRQGSDASAARARTVDLLTARPVERIAFLHSGATDLDAFRTEVLAAPARRRRSGARHDRGHRAVGGAPCRSRLRRRRGAPAAVAPGVPAGLRPGLRDGYGPATVPLRLSCGPIRPGEASPFGPMRRGSADWMIGPV